MEEFKTEAKRISEAVYAEDFFGELSGNREKKLRSIKAEYRRVARIVHPDVTGNDDAAKTAFERLNKLNQLAIELIENGAYGEKSKAIRELAKVESSRGEITIAEVLSQGFYNLYQGSVDGMKVVLKVPLHPDDNDLMDREARALTKIRSNSAWKDWWNYTPDFLETVRFRSLKSPRVRTANLFGVGENELFSLEEVRQQYPNGIDSRNVAWIWRRLLFTLEMAHANGVIHGAVLPHNILVHPGERVGEHGLVLDDWTYSVIDPRVSGQTIPGIWEKYRDFYPPEVFSKSSPLPATDIYMAASSMLFLLGVESVSQIAEPAYRRYFERALNHDIDLRPRTAADYQRQFETLIDSMWGSRKYVTFSMSK